MLLHEFMEIPVGPAFTACLVYFRLHGFLLSGLEGYFPGQVNVPCPEYVAVCVGVNALFTAGDAVGMRHADVVDRLPL